MIKRGALFILFLFFQAATWAQVDNSATNAPAKKTVQKPSRDFLMIQLTYEGLAGAPDSINLKGLHRGLNMYLCYDFPLGKSHMSFAAGIGIGSANYYLKDQRIANTDTGALGSQIRFIAEDPARNYTKYKLNATYFEAPFELRYFSNKENRNKGFKAAIGLRVGTLLSSHTKGNYKVNNLKFTDKTITKRYIEPWRIASTLRVGYGNFTLLGTYNLNNLFRSGQGPEVTPFSIGLAITGL